MSEIPTSITSISCDNTLKGKPGKPSLMILNDNCVIEIFKLLGLVDFVNLSSTCTRMQHIANNVSRRKYNKIMVESNGLTTDTKITKEQYVRGFTQIGTHVLEVEIKEGNQFILETINEKCENLNILTLNDCYGPLQLPTFKYLKELLCFDIRMSKNEWRLSFEINRDLSRFECYNNQYEEGFMELLKRLPKLKSFGFEVPVNFHLSQDFQDLLRLNGLTELTLISSDNCNQLLLKLSKMSNLVILKVMMLFNADSFEIFKSFRNLESLIFSKLEYMNDWEKEWFSDATVFPPKLKRIDVHKLKISCSAFLSIVKQLTFLETFETHSGDIFWDHDTCKSSRLATCSRSHINTFF